MSDEGQMVTLGDQLRGWLPVRRPAVLRGPAERRLTRRLARAYRPDDPPAARRRGNGLADVLVLQLDQPGRGGVVLKHAHSAPAAAALAREWEVLTRLRHDERLGAWRHLIPVPLDRRLDAPLPLITQSLLPGRDAEAVLSDADPDTVDRVARLALSTLAVFGRASVRPEPSAGRTKAWVTEPLAVVRDRVPWCRAGANAAGLTAVGERLAAYLDGRTLAVGWAHGDYHPGNLLLDERSSRVTGVIDWGEGREDGPVAVDACTFVLMLRCLRTGAALGPLVASILRAGALTPDDATLLASARPPGSDGGADPESMLLAWLWHVAANVSKSPRYGRSRIWYRRAVAPVLAEAVRWPGR
ncbi:phosphotransferase family protein [Streptacidiphilus neutrinimicus]|uniref:phosphotransferase family protein n=1 Tax=Streptacidiphilus neutrinimicus TaxID=105420 RepID=UPI0009FE89C8|nr:aminoglycoside phosphotransferase family protein [Streptacidiphilus neutrinimicus]